MESRVLAVNSGSSSIKVSLLTKNLSPVLEAHIAKKRFGVKKELLNIFESFLCQEPDAFSSLLTVGHRFVHGKDVYGSSVQIDKKVKNELEKLAFLAPLHNKASLEAIQASLGYFGSNIPQVAVFDTAFHSTMPPKACTYAIDYRLAKKYGIRRFGFHGIAHQFLWETYKEFSNNAYAKVITVHLGNGCSIAAIKAGISVDTSMGFTPESGLVMATRAGDVDASVVAFLCRKENKNADEVLKLFNESSGLLGVSGVSPNMEVLLKKQSKRAKLAIDLFCYRAAKYIGAYLAVLGGADAIIFSGGIGEHAGDIRNKIIEYFHSSGVVLDDRMNKNALGVAKGSMHQLSKKNSKVGVYVIGCDENRLIAKEALKFI